MADGPFRRLVAPLIQDLGDRLSRVAGISEPLAIRLKRLHSTQTPAEFRTRQALMCLLAFLGGAVASMALALPAGVAALVVLGSPALAFLLTEQSLVRITDKWRRSVSSELPVVEEQLAMLLNAGYSLGSALNHLASRGNGEVAKDVSLVVNRVRQGLSEVTALEEWSERARVEGVTRLVAILTVHAHTADLGRLVSNEARACRRDLQRRDTETIEKRSQQVWVPVTVATLVPGVILLAVPFLSALSSFSKA
jgi:Flp pilus assembly protein TadB